MRWMIQSEAQVTSYKCRKSDWPSLLSKAAILLPNRISWIESAQLCENYPDLVITDQGVGEGANTVRLSRAEWNELVRLITSGTLREV